MKTKNILVLLMLLIFGISQAQEVTKRWTGETLMTDSADAFGISKKTIFRHLGPQLDLGNDGDVTFNLDLFEDAGELIFKKKQSGDQLLVYDDDTHTWDFKYPISVNGVTITTGGGDAYLGNRQTFTKRQVFTDTLKADGLSLIDNARITDILNVTGDVISDLNFLKGSAPSIGSIDNYNVNFIRNNATMLSLTSSATNIVGTAIVGLKVALSDTTMYLQNVSSNLVSRVINTKKHSFLVGVTEKFSVDTTGITTPGNANVSGNTYTGGLSVTNDAQVFGNLYITGTTTSAVDLNTSGNTTVSGDLTTAYAKIGADATYVATKVVKLKLASTTNSNSTVAHGITDWHRITAFNFVIQEDSTNRVLPSGYNATTGLTVGSAVNLDSLNCAYYMPVGSVNLTNDSAFFTITYHK